MLTPETAQRCPPSSGGSYSQMEALVLEPSSCLSREPLGGCPRNPQSGLWRNHQKLFLGKKKSNRQTCKRHQLTGSTCHLLHRTALRTGQARRAPWPPHRPPPLHGAEVGAARPPPPLHGAEDGAARANSGDRPGEHPGPHPALHALSAAAGLRLPEKSHLPLPPAWALRGAPNKGPANFKAPLPLLRRCLRF